MGIKDLRKHTGQPWSSCEEFYDFNNRGIVPDWMKPKAPEPTPSPTSPPAAAPTPQPAPSPTPQPTGPVSAPVLATLVRGASRLARLVFPAPAGMNWISAVALIQKDHDFLVATGDQEDKLEVQGFPPDNQTDGLWVWVFSAKDQSSGLIELTANGDGVSVRSKDLATGQEKVLSGEDSDVMLRGIAIGAVTVLGAREKLNAAKAAATPAAPPEAPSVP